MPMTYRKPWISIRPSASKESRRGGLDLAVEGSAGSQVPWAWRLRGWEDGGLTVG